MYEVQKIVSKRQNPKTGKDQYLVKWIGYPTNQNTWEPQKNLCNVKSMIHKYNRLLQQPTKTSPNLKKVTHDQNKTYQDEPPINDDDDDTISQNSIIIDSSDKTDKLTSFKKTSTPEKRSHKIKKTKTISPTKDLKVTGIAFDETDSYIYRILIDGKLKWVKRSYLIPKFLLQLCEFYEQNLIIKN